MLNIQTKHILGSGVYGTVYLCDYNGKEAVVKFEKIDLKWMNNRYQSQVIFDKEVAQRNPDFFTTMKMHGVINNSSYTMETPNTASSYFFGTLFRTKIRMESDSYDCVFAVQTPVLARTIDSVSVMPNQTENLRRVMKTFDILKKERYTHNDAHGGNWMLDKNDKIWLIDYGSAHKGITDEFQTDILITLSYFVREPFSEINKQPDMPSWVLEASIVEATKGASYLYAIPVCANDNVRRMATVLLCILFDWDLYMKTMYSKETLPAPHQPNKFIVTHIIRHMYDDDYSEILDKVNKFTPFAII